MDNLDYISKNIETVCRTCLQSSNEMKSIFSEIVEETQLSNMITECCLTKVHESDRLPKKICIKCIDNVKQTFNFKQQCEKSFKILNELVGDLKIEVTTINLEHCKNKKHEYTQTDEQKVYLCEICDSKYETFDALQAHRLNHKGDELKCKKCSKVYTRLYQFERHMASVHPEIINKNNSHYARRRNTDIKIEGDIKHELSDIEDVTVSVVEFSPTHDNYETASTDMPIVDFLEIKTECYESDNVNDIDKDSSQDNESSSDKKDSSKTRGRSTKITTKRKRDSSTDSSSSESKYSDIVEPEKIKKTVILKCEACDKTFTRMQNLLQHERTHRFDSEKRSQCDLCPQAFVSSYSLMIHKRKEHTPKKVKEKDHTEEKTEICEICKKGFTKLKYLKNHKKTHQPRKCKLCDEVFTNKVDLQEHKKTHAAERPYLCTECGMRFVRNDFLEIHMRRHTGEKPFKCKYCEKGFACSTELSLHERYHTGKKPHLCTICGKGFPRSYSLAVHTRIHTGERPYKCPHCEKTFVQCKDLKAHVQRHTGERYKCELCNECFVQQYLLTQHKRDRHGLNIKSHIGRVQKFLTPPTLPADDGKSKPLQLQSELHQIKPDNINDTSNITELKDVKKESEMLTIETDIQRQTLLWQTLTLP